MDFQDPMRSITTVLLDLDGTIIDSGPGIKRCLRHTLRHYGIEEPGEEVLDACVGPPLTDTFHHRFGIPQEQVAEAISVYRREYNAGGIFECRLYPGIADCIRTLYEKGYDIAIASSKVEDACRSLMEHFALDRYFYDIVGSTPDAGREKKVDVINAFFARHLEQKKEETLLVGDTFFDAEGAALAGVPFVAVTYGYGSIETLKDSRALALLSSAGEIIPWITSHSISRP